MPKPFRLLFLDIETAPNIAYIWRFGDMGPIPIDRIVSPGYTLCWAAKWHGESAVMFDSVHQSTTRAMLKGIHTLIDEADALCHYNGTRFDLPILRQEFLQQGLRPPAPAKQIDLLITIQQQFRFPSSKLDYVCKALEIGAKVEHKGMDLWRGCMNGNAEDWKMMERYNKQDVKLLEPLYEKVRPWMRTHPNMGLYVDSKKPVCPFCGEQNLQRRGVAYTTVFMYPRFECKSCGKWSRGRENSLDPKRRASILFPAQG